MKLEFVNEMACEARKVVDGSAKCLARSLHARKRASEHSLRKLVRAAHALGGLKCSPQRLVGDLVVMYHFEATRSLFQLACP